MTSSECTQFPSNSPLRSQSKHPPTIINWSWIRKKMLDSEVQIKHFKEVLIEVSLGQEWEEDESIALKKFQPEIPDSLVCYAWAGATFGINSGKVWYEVKYMDNMEVKVENEPATTLSPVATPLLRARWLT